MVCDTMMGEVEKPVVLFDLTFVCAHSQSAENFTADSPENVKNGLKLL